ncbi:glycoside hydrolase family 2 protein [Gordonibacter urolithinfaciens]|uniref:glycoside hydrolase family 2 protein n=1 Tax=Gordonibacter urolithinfaciens TaxID=1335613 RepID=UPI001D073568|nr:sugar-binding domain-containing protein [Gordonibacter urolithinfaciens]MCB6562319.1 glycoside hydrolase family 2 [Gordonibacter urolithinfaciens]MCB7086581.1 glycoside hydrolase family 2 [Gordonibacter urolithinfaciens]
MPFSPEAPLSGVRRQVRPDELLWYRRALSCTKPAGGERVILHFDAVDWACACYVNGTRVGEHRGGYLPFCFDVTDALADGENEVALCVWDPSDAGTQLRGKQRLARGGIWYTAQSGIWQSVWLETVPEEHVVALVIDPRPDEGKLMLSAAVRGEATLAVRLLDDDREVARGEARAENGRCELALDVPNPHLWSPDDPHLYDLELSFGRDRVKSYCAFRTVGVEPDAQGVPRFCLNHEPLFLRGVLDQGYWPDGLMTAPDDEALAHDVRAMREAGFNLLRKHIKVESDRFYWWCDKLGMLVWQDMVSGGAAPNPWHSSYKPTFFRSSWGRYADDDPRRFPGLAADDPAFRAEWAETCAGTVRHLRNHPCVVAWVLFNEAWGQFDACRAVEAVRALDPTRPIDAVSGWYDQRCGDFLSVHNYFRPLEVYPDAAQPPRAFVISEFGGLSHHVDGHSSLETSYGYGSSSDLASFRGAVRATLARADALEGEGLAGYVYTQLSDVEEETNGILTYDRRVNKLAEGGAS